jgi:hypothetical protein
MMIATASQVVNFDDIFTNTPRHPLLNQTEPLLTQSESIISIWGRGTVSAPGNDCKSRIASLQHSRWRQNVARESKEGREWIKALTRVS